MFTKMLLDALHKAPPRSVDELVGFFERSRSRLEQSLDKGQVSDDERARYLGQFQEALNEVQVQFINGALDAQSTGGQHPDGQSSSSARLKAAFRQPLVWALVMFALVVGVAVGVLLPG